MENQNIINEEKGNDVNHVLANVIFEKDHIVNIIKNRIKSEYKKHPDLDWQQIAAIKIYSFIYDINKECICTCDPYNKNELNTVVGLPNICTYCKKAIIDN